MCNMHVSVQIQAFNHTHVSSFIFSHFIVLKQGFSVNWKFAVSARLADHCTLGIWWSLPLIAAVTGMCSHAWLFMWMLEI